jgi:hypothetical protein
LGFIVTSRQIRRELIQAELTYDSQYEKFLMKNYQQKFHYSPPDKGFVMWEEKNTASSMKTCDQAAD